MDTILIWLGNATCNVASTIGANDWADAHYCHPAKMAQEAFGVSAQAIDSAISVNPMMAAQVNQPMHDLGVTVLMDAFWFLVGWFVFRGIVKLVRKFTKKA